MQAVEAQIRLFDKRKALLWIHFLKLITGMQRVFTLTQIARGRILGRSWDWFSNTDCVSWCEFRTFGFRFGILRGRTAHRARITGVLPGIERIHTTFKKRNEIGVKVKSFLWFLRDYPSFLGVRLICARCNGRANDCNVQYRNLVSPTRAQYEERYREDPRYLEHCEDESDLD